MAEDDAFLLAATIQAPNHGWLPGEPRLRQRIPPQLLALNLCQCCAAGSGLTLGATFSHAPLEPGNSLDSPTVASDQLSFGLSTSLNSVERREELQLAARSSTGQCDRAIRSSPQFTAERPQSI
jgi:hypothetical protein